MQILLYNTLTRKKDVFEPLDGKEVRLYACGPTVYNYAHIGNLRTYVFEDLLRRTLEYANFKVHHVMNITDVGHLVSDADDGEDKMELSAKKSGKSAYDIAEYYTKVFFEDLNRLNIKKPHTIPKATEHIPEMIDMIQKLEKASYTYRTSDGIYYDTKKFPSYSNLARLEIDSLQAGKRVSMGEKKNITDFALWKFSNPKEKRQMEWDSPWGKGFPGWHIECSSMSMKYLGDTLDIHCGGKDHIPIHHTNEIAQSEGVTNKPFSRFWMHGNFLVEAKNKMSKSAGEFLTLKRLEEKGFSALDYRFLILQVHYRKDLSFHFDSMDAAKNGLANIYKQLKEWRDIATTESLSNNGEKYKNLFQEAIYNDINISQALALFSEMIKSTDLEPGEKKNLSLDFDRIFGLDFQKEMEKKEDTQELNDEIKAIIQDRDRAREEKDWQKSDELRQKLEDKGYNILDTKKGTKVKPK